MKKSLKRKKARKIKKLNFVLIALVAGIVIYLAYVIVPVSKQIENEINLTVNDVIDNRTVHIGQNDYYAYPLALYLNQTVRVYISTEDKINTLFLASLQFEQYKNISMPSFKSIKYFIEASFFGVRSGDFSFTAPENDTYYFLIGKKALIQEQPPLSGNSSVRMLVMRA